MNGRGSSKLDPGGDVLAAYWLARASDATDSQKNLSAFARAPLPYTRTTPGDDADAGPTAPAHPTESSSGCGCGTAARAGGMPFALLLLLAATIKARRARRS